MASCLNDFPLIRTSSFFLKSISVGLIQTSIRLMPTAWIMSKLLRLLEVTLMVAGLRFLPKGSAAWGAVVRPGKNSRMTMP